MPISDINDVERGNIETFERDSVLDAYMRWDEISVVEREVIYDNVAKDARVLDVGCGAGRFYPYLKSLGIKEYLGIDISKKMIDICVRKYGNNGFEVRDAGDIYGINGGFDAVICMHNSIDLVHPKEKRVEVIKSAGRKLVRGGVFIFSSHIEDWLSDGAEIRSKRWATPDRRELRLSGAEWGYCREAYNGYCLMQYRTSVKACTEELKSYGYSIVETKKDVSRIPPEWCYYICRL